MKNHASILFFSILTLTACQQERIALNEASEEISKTINNKEEISKEDTGEIIEKDGTVSISNPNLKEEKETKISKVTSTEIIDYAGENFYFKTEYPSNFGKLKVSKSKEAQRLATETFEISNSEETLMYINVYDEYALETAYEEIEDIETEVDNSNYSFDLIFVTENEHFQLTTKSNFYAEDLD